VCIKFKVLDKALDNILILDSKHINISRIVELKSGKELPWKVVSEHSSAKALGHPVLIELTEDLSTKGSEFELQISFSSTDKSSAIQWFEKEQTRNKDYPLMFTQCQPIHARTLIPCQVR
jgi:leukotriene-A4 hydrolase